MKIGISSSNGSGHVSDLEVLWHSTKVVLLENSTTENTALGLKSLRRSHPEK
jgi:hypothetical protein